MGVNKRRKQSARSGYRIDNFEPKIPAAAELDIRQVFIYSEVKR